MGREQLGPYTLSWPEGVFPLGEDALMRTFYLVYGDRLLLTSAALRFIDFACRFQQGEGISLSSTQA